MLTQYEAFRTRDLSEVDVAYLFLDAVYEPLRRYGAKVAVLCMWGITYQGTRVLLHLSVGNGEDKERVKEALRDLTTRGLTPPVAVTTDGAPGLCRAVDEVFPRSQRIRCWFHNMQNLQSKVPPEMWEEFKAQVIDARDAPTFEEGQRRMNAVAKAYEKALPSASRCVEEDQEASLSHLKFPKRHQLLIRTTNLVERSFLEERRRTKIIPHFWGKEESLVKLVFAVLIRLQEKWSTRQFSRIEEEHLYKLREKYLGKPSPELPKEVKRRKRRSASRVA